MTEGKKVLVFDVDDTIYDLMWPFQMAYEKILAGRACVSCEVLFEKSRIFSDIVLEKEKQGLVLPEEAFYLRMKMACEDVGISITREESDAFEKEYRYYQTKIEPFDYMEEVLDYCKKMQIRRAVLTNGNRRAQGRKLSALRLERWFDADRMFISGEIGYHKPDVRAFQTVQDRLAVPDADIWYIGDTYENDIAGAHHAGWHTIWLNHRKRRCPDAVSLADRELTCGREVLPVIKMIFTNQGM